MAIPENAQISFSGVDLPRLSGCPFLNPSISKRAKNRSRGSWSSCSLTSFPRPHSYVSEMWYSEQPTQYCRSEQLSRDNPASNVRVQLLWLPPSSEMVQKDGRDPWGCTIERHIRQVRFRLQQEVPPRQALIEFNNPNHPLFYNSYLLDVRFPQTRQSGRRGLEQVQLPLR